MILRKRKLIQAIRRNQSKTVQSQVRTPTRNKKKVDASKISFWVIAKERYILIKKKNECLCIGGN